MVSDDRAVHSDVPDAIVTDRLVLRLYDRADRAWFAELNSDPSVMEWLGGTLSAVESDALLDRLIDHRDDHGFAPWCVEVDGTPVGWAGLLTTDLRPEVEVGWRLDSSYWGHGYATEAALAAVDHGFVHLGLSEMISFTAAINQRSINVMARIGMEPHPEGRFEHPRFGPGHPLRTHVLYHLTRKRWSASDLA